MPSVPSDTNFVYTEVGFFVNLEVKLSGGTHAIPVKGLVISC